jgi:hypothetical protein
MQYGWEDPCLPTPQDSAKCTTLGINILREVLRFVVTMLSSCNDGFLDPLLYLFLIPLIDNNTIVHKFVRNGNYIVKALIIRR